MNGPPGQKKAPRSVDALQGAKTDGTENTANPSEPKPGVNAFGDSAWARRGVPAPRSGAAPLPCLNSNISIQTPLAEAENEKLNQLSTSHRKTAFALAQNVARLCSKYGIERIAFLTLTFADHVTCAKEAGRRFNSLRSNVLASRYAESICVLERMKSGRIHFHLLVVLAVDVRTGFSFEEAASGQYGSANAALRSEWAFWRATAKLYGFGRSELMPVKSNEEGLSKYVGKYIAKHIGNRETRDKGVRLVRYSRGAKPFGTAFMFRSPRSRLWRWQVGEFARRNGCLDLDAIKAKFGVRWAHSQRATILALEPEPIPCGVTEEGEMNTLQDVWAYDRHMRTLKIAMGLGLTVEEVNVALDESGFAFRQARWTLDPEVRAAAKEKAESDYSLILARELKVLGVRLAALNDEGERVERTTVWRDGTFEKHEH